MAHDSDTRNIFILLYPVYGKLHGHLALQQPHSSHVAHDDGSCTNRMRLCYKIYNLANALLLDKALHRLLVDCLAWWSM
jgi:hypothetical protein